MKKNKKAYSVIIALLITWFLLLLVVWVFNLVLKELSDNRAMWNYYKAYYWAESAQELALLKIKEKWYWIDEDIDYSINDKSVLLSKNPKDKNLFKANSDVFISYNLATKTNSYSWYLTSLEYDIIPLFYINPSWVENKISDLIFSVDSWNQDWLLWNIVSKDSWISWTWNFDWNIIVNKKITNASLLWLTQTSINSFLNQNTNNYLIVFNSTNSAINYSLNSTIVWEYFSKPRTYIISSAKIGNYRQNLRTYLNNTEYLSILKYSILSN